MANKLTTFLNSGTNNYLTPQVSFNRLATDLLVPGVVGTTTNTSGAAPTTGSFGVNAQGTPNMSVAINQGQAWVSATPTGSVAQNFSVTSDGSETVTINSNTTGSTVYDFIYIQLSATLLNNPDVAGLTVATFITSRSSTAYSASGANNGNSNGAIANSLLLGVVTVVNNATSISNSNITDGRPRMGTTPSTSGATVSSLYNPYKFFVYLTTSFNVSSPSPQKVNLNAKVYDTGSNFDITTNYRFTAPVAGFYQFFGTAQISINSAYFAAVLLYKNGSPYIVGVGGAGSSVNVNPTTGGLIQLAAGDYVELWAQNSFGSGGGVSGSTAPYVTYFSGYLVSAT